MPFPVWRLAATIATITLLGACTLPQDVAEVNQVLKGADAPEATFAVQYVTRDTLPLLRTWPNSHPTPNLGWITHADTARDPLIEAGDKIDLTIWDNDETSLLSLPSQKVIQLPGLLVSTKGTVFLPYADEVYIAKMTPDQARQAIQDKLLSIIPSAQVQLAFTSGRNNSVELVSGVPNPGRYPLIDRDTTLTSGLCVTSTRSRSWMLNSPALNKPSALVRSSAKIIRSRLGPLPSARTADSG